MPTQAVAGDGHGRADRDEALTAQRVDPRLHVGDLAEGPAELFNLHRVGGLVVARGVVDESVERKLITSWPCQPRAGRVRPDVPNNVPLKPVGCSACARRPPTR